MFKPAITVRPFDGTASVKKQVIAGIENAVGAFRNIYRNFGKVVDIRFSEILVEHPASVTVNFYFGRVADVFFYFVVS